MNKDKFVYNKQTLRYEKVEGNWKRKLVRAFGFLSAVGVFAVIIVFIAFKYLDSPKEKALKRELNQLITVNELQQDEMKHLTTAVEKVQERENTLYRVMFGMEPRENGVAKGGTGGRDKYKDLAVYKNAGATMVSTFQRLEQLKFHVANQSRSLDTIAHLVKEKEQMLSSIPSIKPVREDKLKRSIQLMSGFGYRLHPIHRVMKMHAGIDFTAPSGTPIYATGNGTVEKVENRASGYGRNVTINHGFGYKTLYAHMSKMLVKPGQKVKKGQKIGLVGNTGTSTAPHLHYEVRKGGSAVNPIHYCMDGLTPQEYAGLVDAADKASFSID